MEPNNVLFKYIMAGVVYVNIDPLAWILFTNVRKTSKAGILQFLTLVSEFGAAKIGSDVSEIF